MSGPAVKLDAKPRPDVLRGLTRALLAIAALLALAWLYARLQSPVAYYGTPYQGRPRAATFAATDQNGRPFDFASTRGNVTALFFGFTHCPDVCPLTLSYLQKARAELSESERDKLRLVFVTLDPERDTPEVMREYLNFYGGGITGLYLPPDKLRDVAADYKVSYAKAPVKGSNEYFINHTTATYVIDPEGRMRLAYDYTQLPQVSKVVRDLKSILGEKQ